MSLASYVDLVKWTPARSACGATLDVDSAPDAVPIQGTLSQLDDSGSAIFVRNVPLWVMRGAPVGLHFERDAEPRLSREFRCWAIIAEPMSAGDDNLAKDWTLFAAAWPYSRGWWESSSFKPRWNDSRGALRQRAAKALRDSTDWRDFIRELPENPFSTQKNVRKAVLLDPNKIAETTVPGRYFNLPRTSTLTGTPTAKVIVPSTCYGLCRNPEACREALRNDPLVCELIDSTLDRSLFRRFHAGHPNLDVFEKSVHPAAGLVVEGLANTNRVNDVLTTAITLALAGPDSFESFRAYDDDGRPRKLVVTLVRDIYLELMWNLQRRARTALNRRAPEPPTVRAEVSATDNESGSTLADVAVRELTEQLRAQSPSELRSLVRRALHDFDYPGEVQWQVADGVPTDEAGTDDADEIFAKLWETCALAVALSRLGVRDPRLAACVAELADDASPSVQRLARMFLPLM